MIIRLHRFHKLFLKTLSQDSNENYRYKGLVYKYNSTRGDLAKGGINIPDLCFYDNVINKAIKFKPDTSQ